MKNKSPFAKLAQHIVHPHKELRNPRIMHPQREWFAGLLVMAVGFSVVAAWSAHMFLSHQNVSISSNDIEEDTPTVIYRASLVESALEEFAAKEQQYQTILAQESLPPSSATTSTSATTTGTDILDNNTIQFATSTNPQSDEPTATSDEDEVITSTTTDPSMLEPVLNN